MCPDRAGVPGGVHEARGDALPPRARGDPHHAHAARRAPRAALVRHHRRASQAGRPRRSWSLRQRAGQLTHRCRSLIRWGRRLCHIRRQHLWSLIRRRRKHAVRRRQHRHQRTLRARVARRAALWLPHQAAAGHLTERRRNPRRPTRRAIAGCCAAEHRRRACAGAGARGMAQVRFRVSAFACARKCEPPRE